jgi:hypothetical protein
MKTLLLLALISLAVPAFGQSSGRFTITRSVIAGGGATSTNTTFSMGSTVGEPVPSSTNTNGQFTIRSGFWVQPAPYVFAPRVANGNFLFSFETQPGQIYLAQYKDSLGNPSWQTLLTIAGDGTIKTATNSVPNADLQFYRLVEQ